jgi:hypothetical protein
MTLISTLDSPWYALGIGLFFIVDAIARGVYRRPASIWAWIHEVIIFTIVGMIFILIGFHKLQWV